MAEAGAVTHGPGEMMGDAGPGMLAGVRVIEVPGSEILKSGGGIRCRTMQIYREQGPTLDDVRQRRWRK